MKKVLSLILAFILISIMVVPAFATTASSSPDCVTITINAPEEKNIICRIFHFVMDIFVKIFRWISGWFKSPGPGPEPPIDIPTPTDPEPPKEPTDPNENIPNGFVITGSKDHKATTREVAYELIYDNFKDTPGFNPGSKYVINETDNAKVNRAVNYILDNNCGDALVYIGINKVEETETRVNICPNSLVTTAFLQAMLFSIPTVSQIIILNDDPHAPLSKEQVDLIIKYAVLYTRIKDGKLIDSCETITRQKACEIFQNVFADIGLKKLTITNPEEIATIEFIDYLAVKFTGSVSGQCFGEACDQATQAIAQFIAELGKLQLYSSVICYQAE